MHQMFVIQAYHSKIHILYQILTIVLIFSALDCGNKKDQIRIGVSIDATTFPVYTLMKQALMENSKKYGVKILWNDVQSGDRSLIPVARELAGVKKMLKAGIKVLIIKPVSFKIYPILRETRRWKVPVISLDTIPTDVPVTGHIKVNEIDLGRKAAENAIEILKLWYPLKKPTDRWNVIVLEGAVGVEKLRRIVLGIYEALDQYQQEIQVVSSPQVSGADAAFDVVSKTIGKYAGNIQAIITADSELAVGAVQAVKISNLLYEPGWNTDPEKRKGFAYVEKKGIVTAGVGAGKEACRLIFKGEHVIEIDEMPYQRALTALEAAFDVLEKKQFPSDGLVSIGVGKVDVKYSPIRVVTKDNVREMEQMWADIFR
jgi:ABC-type sugar transport system substrate-binding protein